ncbi:homing endonuclease associated repeat-containing protein [Haloarcula sp. Atlit-7R]|uniref:homing endonuclease associated repeat-containing protein n=1 Tax=Haloarcula sp. Atlit-7R TaxID=2282125 RepID=UPI0011C49DD8|nr:hypothetical protein [Haloarcula sp. Atlit-7R]
MSEPTTDELLDEICRLKRELDKTPASTDMDEIGQYSVRDYQKEFGKWNDALREAGLEPNQPKKIPTDELLNEIQRLARKFHKVPTKKQMNDIGEYYGGSYQRRFGSWSEAIRQAGFEPNQQISESDFRNKPSVCQLCDSPTRKLDFHHWRYGSNKAGCYLCRDCHDQVHADGARPREDTDWLITAVENLIRAHRERGKKIDASTISERYNIPSENLVEHVIEKIGT